MGAKESKEIVRKFFKVMDSRDVDAVLNMLTEDATWWVIGSLPGVSGTRNKEEQGKLMRYMLPLIGDAPKMTVDHVIAEGNFVAAETHTAGKTPKGEQYDNRYHFKFEIKGDKIFRIRAYNDTALIKAAILGK